MTATITPLSAGTDVGETIGGKLVGRSTLHDSAGVEAIGDVGASPAANTLLGRLKAIATLLGGGLPASLGPKTGATSLSIVPASDAGLATAAKQDEAKADLDAISTNVASALIYAPVALSSSNLAGGACKRIVAEVAGRVKLKQPDGTVRDNYPLVAGENRISALMIDAPTSGDAASGVWAHY
jgi:hypothetical protein